VFKPSQYREYWTDRDGRTVILRSITPNDKQIERELIDGLSPESSRYRFFRWIKKASDEMVGQLCDIDPNNEVAIMAEYTENKKRRNVGVARLFLDADLRGEFTIVVADDFQGHGLGRKFLEILFNIGRAKGLKSIYGTVLQNNNKMLSLMKKFGFSISKSLEHEIDVILHL
jgi:acetyltransferase